MTIPIYIAGASSEIDRARAAMDLVRSTPGLSLAHDWVAEIDRAGEANPADHFTALNAAIGCDMGLHKADVLWLLLPYPGNRTIGAWIELGMWLNGLGRRDKVTITSGLNPERSVFLAIADDHRELDADAFDLIRAMVPEVEEVRRG